MGSHRHYGTPMSPHCLHSLLWKRACEDLQHPLVVIVAGVIVAGYLWLVSLRLVSLCPVSVSSWLVSLWLLEFWFDTGRVLIGPEAKVDWSQQHSSILRRTRPALSQRRATRRLNRKLLLSQTGYDVLLFSFMFLKGGEGDPATLP